ncbi:DENN domain-containing protein Crag [Frankliniella fusca]|uniref:DENN domain-containing protein Crag n=1 Tax=Frankliniella fusca TaxID=407009 RepID=A0AAE1HAG9_9NEOP|nr:DENN domain-containing protein Crag [Frankliniella fusca]
MRRSLRSHGRPAVSFASAADKENVPKKKGKPKQTEQRACKEPSVKTRAGSKTQQQPSAFIDSSALSQRGVANISSQSGENTDLASGNFQLQETSSSVGRKLRLPSCSDIKRASEEQVEPLNEVYKNARQVTARLDSKPASAQPKEKFKPFVEGNSFEEARTSTSSLMSKPASTHLKSMAVRIYKHDNALLVSYSFSEDSEASDKSQPLLKNSHRPESNLSQASQFLKNLPQTHQMNPNRRSAPDSIGFVQHRSTLDGSDSDNLPATANVQSTTGGGCQPSTSSGRKNSDKLLYAASCVGISPDSEASLPKSVERTKPRPNLKTGSEYIQRRLAKSSKVDKSWESDRTCLSRPVVDTFKSRKSKSANLLQNQTVHEDDYDDYDDDPLDKSYEPMDSEDSESSGVSKHSSQLPERSHNSSSHPSKQQIRKNSSQHRPVSAGRIQKAVTSTQPNMQLHARIQQSVQEEDRVNSDVAPTAHSMLGLSPDLPRYDVKEILKSKCQDGKGKEYFELLQSGKRLDSKERKFVLRILVRWLYMNHASDPKAVTTDMKEGLAKSIVTTYPALKCNTLTESITQAGFRIVLDTFRKKHRKRKTKSRKTAEEDQGSSEYGSDEIENLAQVMPSRLTKDDISRGMLACFKTRKVERKRGATIDFFLKKYPHFKHFKGEIIVEEFQLMFPEALDMSRPFLAKLEKMLALPPVRRINLQHDDEIVRALVLLSHHLPHDIPSRGEKFDHSWAREEDLFVVLTVNDSIPAYVSQRLAETPNSPIQPYMILIKSQIDQKIVQVFLILDTKEMEVVTTSRRPTLQALSILMQAYCVFNVCHPFGWRNTLHFVQHYFMNVMEEQYFRCSRGGSYTSPSEIELWQKLQ